MRPVLLGRAGRDDHDCLLARESADLGGRQQRETDLIAGQSGDFSTSMTMLLTWVMDSIAAVPPRRPTPLPLPE